MNEVLTARVPFEGMEVVQVMYAIPNGVRPPAVEAVPDDGVLTDLRGVVARCWGDAASGRPSAGSVAGSVRSLLHALGDDPRNRTVAANEESLEVVPVAAACGTVHTTGATESSGGRDTGTRYASRAQVVPKFKNVL